MRSNAVAAAVIFAAVLGGTSQAAEIGEHGAKELRGALTQFLPRDLANGGFVTVTPAGNRYEVGYDLSKFFDKISSANFAISGLKPFSMFAEPMEKGLWKIDGDNAFDISINSSAGKTGGSTLNYSMASLVYTGVFDPAISYMRSMEVTGKGMKMLSVVGQETTEATNDDINYKVNTVDGAKPGQVDVQVTSATSGFSENIITAGAPAVGFKSDSMNFDAKATGIPINDLRKLIRFVFEHVKAKELSKSGSDKFKTLVRNAMPLFDEFNETAGMNNLSVTTPFGNAGLTKLGLSIKMNGITKASNIGIGLSAEGLKLDPGMIPATYEALVPDAAVFEVGVPDINFADAMNILLQTDFSKSGPAAKLDEKLGKAILPSGLLTIDFPKVSATSGVYDVELSGTMTGDVTKKDSYSMKATVLARDYDKTIAFIQNAAKTDPDLNQVSFGMMMAKGFAKTDPDGRQRWDVEIADDETVTVNGQVIKAPK
jgi:hypothetical protein